MKNKPELIVALDVDTIEKAASLVKLLMPTVQLFKVGSQLFTSAGHKAVEMIGKNGGKVFLDLKFHDIPQTVYSAVASGTGLRLQDGNPAHRFPVFMMTVHIQGGLEMLREAARAASERANSLKIVKPLIVGVTVLTSDVNTGNTLNEVLKRAKLAQDSGLDGVVCSVEECEAVKKELGQTFFVVTPGIRLQSADVQDQKRIGSPAGAVRVGSNFLVVGRPIVAALDPLAAANEILKQMKGEH